MPTYAACLVDVFDTALSYDAARHLAELAVLAEVDEDVLVDALRDLGPAVSDGRMRVADALAEAVRRSGAQPTAELVEELVAHDLDLLRSLAVVPDDTVPFLRRLRARGVRTAFVSNCADNARPMLDSVGLSDLVDELVLSCEVGAAKPDPRIFEVALVRLGVTAGETLFVDDQPSYCDAAAAMGLRAVLIDRLDGSGTVSSLAELAPYF